MTHRQLLYLSLTALAAACTPTEALDEVTSASWAGEIASMNTMMLMTVAERGTTLSGSGGFSALLVAGSTQSYRISGTRRADTLDILLSRAGESVHFVGWYLSGKRILTGHLTGGDFYGTPVSLAKQ